MNITIRKATANDDKSRAYVLFTSWNETYRGLIDERFINSRDLQTCEKIIGKYQDKTLVAEIDGLVIGFLSYLEESRDFVSVKPSSEIVALYILKKYHNLGVGTKLLEKALELLPHKNVFLFVLKGNINAVEFYKHIGFSFTGKEMKYDVKTAILEEQEMVLLR